MTNWPQVSFLEAFEDVSRGNQKLPQSEYLPTGHVPVIDQGASLIGGYTNDESLVFKGDLPVIIFGDHTRAIKFVNFPFVMGADGVKVLRPRDGWDPKYAYHALRELRLPDAGYSRHFRFLKESVLLSSSVDEQRRIAGILDQTDALRAKRRQALAHLDALTQSIFHDRFNKDSFAPVSARDLMPKMRNGLSPATAGKHSANVLTLSAVTQGPFNPTASKPGLFAKEPPIDKRVSAADFLMCRGNGNKALVAVGAYSAEDRPDLVFPDTVIAGRIDGAKVVMAFLEAAWKQHSVRRQIESVARTTNGTFKINQQTLSSVMIPLPPLTLQRDFAARIEQINTQRATVQRALASDDELFASLQTRAFRGEL